MVYAQSSRCSEESPRTPIGVHGAPPIRAAERGEQEGHFAPGPRGLRSLIIGEF